MTVFSRVVQPPADVSDTYTYSVRSEGSKEREVLSVHFKGSMRAVDKNLIIIDHILQFPENGTGLGPSLKALTDNRLSSIITANFPLKLEEGYVLAIKAVDSKGDRACFELYKDGIVVIAAHFKNAFSAADQDLATIDGIWQISDTPTKIA